jgi:hypothetical protein
MGRKFVVGWVVLFVAWFLGDFLVHAVLLKADYMLLPALFRTASDSQGYFPFMMLAHLIMAGAFVWIYARGVEPKPWVAQGARFGLAAALLSVVPNYLVYYAIEPLPGSLVVRQIVYSGILLVLLGVIVAWVYRPRGSG